MIKAYELVDWVDRVHDGDKEARKALKVALFVIGIVASAVVFLFSGKDTFVNMVLIATALYGVYVMSFRILVGSSVIAVLLKYQLGNFHSMVDAFAPHKWDKFFDLVDRTGTIEIAMAVFFVGFSLSFLTSCFRLFHAEHVTHVTVEHKTEAPKPDRYPGSY